MKKLTPTQIRVLNVLRSSGRRGLTADELTAEVAWDKNSAAPRLTELSQLGLAVPTRERRPTSAGGSAAVWIAASVADTYSHPITMHTAGPTVTTRGGGRFQNCRACGASISAGFCEGAVVYERGGEFSAARPIGGSFRTCRRATRAG